MRIFRCEGRFYAIEGIKGEGVKLLEPTPAEVLERRELGDEIPSLGLPLHQVRACFEGPMLHRAQRIAALSATRFSILFGESRKDTLYKHAIFLRRVGQRIPAPESPPGGCGQCTDLMRTCGAACSRRIVHEALKHATFSMLCAAIRHTDPVEQLEAAVSARVDGECAPRKRRPLDFPQRRLREEWENVNGAYRIAGK